MEERLEQIKALGVGTAKTSLIIMAVMLIGSAAVAAMHLGMHVLGPWLVVCLAAQVGQGLVSRRKAQKIVDEICAMPPTPHLLPLYIDRLPMRARQDLATNLCSPIATLLGSGQALPSISRSQWQHLTYYAKTVSWIDNASGEMKELATFVAAHRLENGAFVPK